MDLMTPEPARRINSLRVLGGLVVNTLSSVTYFGSHAEDLELFPTFLVALLLRVFFEGFLLVRRLTG